MKLISTLSRIVARGGFENRHDRAMPKTEFVEYFTSFGIWKMLIVSYFCDTNSWVHKLNILMFLKCVKNEEIESRVEWIDSLAYQTESRAGRGEEGSRLKWTIQKKKRFCFPNEQISCVGNTIKSLKLPIFLIICHYSFVESLGYGDHSSIICSFLQHKT